MEKNVAYIQTNGFNPTFTRNRNTTKNKKPYRGCCIIASKDLCLVRFVPFYVLTLSMTGWGGCAVSLPGMNSPWLAYHQNLRGHPFTTSSFSSAFTEHLMAYSWHFFLQQCRRQNERLIASSQRHEHGRKNSCLKSGIKYGRWRNYLPRA